MTRSSPRMPWITIPRPRRRGPAVIRQAIAALRSAFPGYRVATHDVFTEGDLVDVRSLAHGTQTGSLLTIPTSGQPVQFETMDFWQVVIGQIVGVWRVEQLFNVLMQIGGVPSGAATPATATPAA